MFFDEKKNTTVFYGIDQTSEFRCIDKETSPEVWGQKSTAPF